MAYYIFIQDEKINGKGECKCLNDDILNIEVDFDTYNDIEKYIYLNGEIVLNPNFEDEQEQKEKERIAKLSLTRGDVFRALYQAKQVTRTQIRALIENNELISEAQRELALIDFDEALNFYRGNTLIDTLGLALGISSKQLDEFFMTNDFTCLMEVVEPTETPSEEPTEVVEEESNIENLEEL